MALVDALAPVRREAFAAQAQAAGSQIGKLLPVGQNDEAIVPSQKM